MIAAILATRANKTQIAASISGHATVSGRLLGKINISSIISGQATVSGVLAPFVAPALGAAMVFMSKDQKIKNAGVGMLIVGGSDLVSGYIPAMIKGVPQTVGNNYNRQCHPSFHAGGEYLERIGCFVPTWRGQ